MKTEEEIREKIKQNECKLMSMGLNGLAYTDYWNGIAKENNELKQKLKEVGK